MMRRYPKFMKALPEFYGLSFVDLGFLMAGLYLSMMLNLNPLFSIVLCSLGVIISKIVRKYFDFTGWLLPRKKEVFIADIKRGEG
jgi:hypothetical protein